MRYAPQSRLLALSIAAITHAGLNTTLEALSYGVPLVAVPVTDDQPGVASRINRVGAGRVVPFKKATASNLEEALRDIIRDCRFREAARRIAAEIRKTDGLDCAAAFIEAHV